MVSVLIVSLRRLQQLPQDLDSEEMSKETQEATDLLVDVQASLELVSLLLME